MYLLNTKGVEENEKIIGIINDRVSAFYVCGLRRQNYIK